MSLAAVADDTPLAGIGGAVARLYVDRIRPLLTRHASALRRELDADLARCADVTALDLAVVGRAGVGKSTLLNALVSDTDALLPRGGVGSLTAKPIRIQYAREPCLVVEYKSRPELAVLADDVLRKDPVALRAARRAIHGTSATATPLRRADAAYCEDQFIDALCGRTRADVHEVDRGRTNGLALACQRVAKGHTTQRWCATWSERLRHELETHAAGFMAPLVRSLSLHWPLPLLDTGLQLIDLPGLGLAHDDLAHETMEVAAMSRAMLVVVDRAVIGEDVAVLLRRLRPGQTVFVVATHLDEIAADRRARAQGSARRPWQDHLADVGTEVSAVIRAQLCQIAGPQVSAAAQITAVAPIEHRRFHRRVAEEPARIDNEGIAGIVSLRAALRRAALFQAHSVVDRLLGALAAIEHPSARDCARELRELRHGRSTHGDR